MSYGSVSLEAVHERRVSTSKRGLALVAAVAAATLGAVAVADVMSKGASATALAAISARRGVLLRMPMLYDAALSPTYTEGADPVYEYSWKGANAQAYDPEFQNAFKDLPMNNVDIKAAEPDREFWGQAPHSMERSCDKTGGCAPPVNVLDFLPSTEAKSMSNRMPVTFSPSDNVFGNMPLDY